MLYATLDNEMYMVFVKEEVEVEKLVPFDWILSYIIWCGDVPLGFIRVKEGIALAEEDGNVDLFVKFAEDKRDKNRIPA